MLSFLVLIQKQATVWVIVISDPHFTVFLPKPEESGLLPEKPGHVLLAPFGHLLSPLPLLPLYLVLLFICLGHLSVLQEPDGRELPLLKPSTFLSCLFGEQTKASSSEPLVWSEARVCRGQDRFQLRGQFIQFSGITGEAVVIKVVLGLCIYVGEKRER